MAVTPDGAKVPIPNIPFLDATTGGPSRPWLYFFIALWGRTGGSNPTTDEWNAGLVEHIGAGLILASTTLSATGSGAIDVSVAFDDVQFPPPPVTLPVGIGQAMGDDVPRAGLNPLLAAMAVMDSLP